ncbi:MAG: ATP-binding protein [Bacteroidales bacterium]|nr:ATP-binding protein [Bacteroidales bacterium]
MLNRKIAKYIEDFFKKEERKILLVNGARQIGKSFIIRHVCNKIFKNYVEINLKEDSEGNRIFESVRSTDDLYIQLSNYSNKPLGNFDDTIIFLDEIQSYPHLLTMLKFLSQERRYRFVASGSQLGIALSQTPSVPIGSVEIVQMYPLDFEEFLWANNTSREWIEMVRKHYETATPLDENYHNILLKRFKYYLLVGGLPEAVNNFLKDRNIINVRASHKSIHELYRIDASQYDDEHKLKIRKIYDLIPSNLENKAKRIVYKDIENKTGKHFADYANEFEYLSNSGVALDITAISNPKFPLVESEQKKLVKLYLNDVGLLTNLLYGQNVNAILQDISNINLGTVYESVVAQELSAHGYKLHYYDNKQNGEVDFLIDDYNSLQVLPLEIKSGKDYKKHTALNKFMSVKDYNIKKTIVLSNEREISTNNGITYMPIYFIMFFQNGMQRKEDTILPELEVV